MRDGLLAALLGGVEINRHLELAPTLVSALEGRVPEGLVGLLE